MRFTQAQPPSALRVFRRPAQKLREECGERLDGAMKSLAWKQGAQQSIALHSRVKRDREPFADFLAAYGLIGIHAPFRSAGYCREITTPDGVRAPPAIA